jgi:hypothetical protein
MADSNLTSHMFNGQAINQLSEDTVIGGVTIPKGYVNATEMCKANGKKLAGYLRNKSTEEFLIAMEDDMQICTSSLIIEIEAYGLQGTWVHHLIALDLAAWISPKFKVWANKTLWYVINGDFKALTPEAQKAKDELDAIWERVRDAGKVTRRGLTDAIKDWYERNPGGTSRPLHAMISHTTNLIYKALWGMDAVQLEKHLGCDRNKSRDFMDEKSLKLVDRAESLVMDYIDEDNIKPVDAVPLANIRKAKTPPLRNS